jgi:hypothetical protein
VIVDNAPIPEGGSWAPDDTILFCAICSIYRASAAGGTATPVTVLDASRQEVFHWWPHFLPDGRRFLYTVRSGLTETGGVYVGSLDGPLKKLVLRTESEAVFAPQGGGRATRRSRRQEPSSQLHANLGIVRSLILKGQQFHEQILLGIPPAQKIRQFQPHLHWIAPRALPPLAVDGPMVVGNSAIHSPLFHQDPGHRQIRRTGEGISRQERVECALCILELSGGIQRLRQRKLVILILTLQRKGGLELVRRFGAASGGRHSHRSARLPPRSPRAPSWRGTSRSQTGTDRQNGQREGADKGGLSECTRH